MRNWSKSDCSVIWGWYILSWDFVGTDRGEDVGGGCDHTWVEATFRVFTCWRWYFEYIQIINNLIINSQLRESRKRKIMRWANNTEWILHSLQWWSITLLLIHLLSRWRSPSTSSLTLLNQFASGVISWC